MTLCDTPDCPREATRLSTRDGARCDECRAEARDAERRRQCNARCVHLRPVADTWAAKFGSEAGRRAWIDSHWTYYRTGRRQYTGESYERTEAQARKAAACAYRRIAGRADEQQPFELECGLGHTCYVQAKMIDLDMPASGGIVHHYGEPSCDRQATCGDYAARGPVLAKTLTQRRAEA